MIGFFEKGRLLASFQVSMIRKRTIEIFFRDESRTYDRCVAVLVKLRPKELDHYATEPLQLTIETLMFFNIV
jgi:hypothetical protein